MPNAPAGTTSIDAASGRTERCAAAAPDIADPAAPTVSQAHEIMQRHLRCLTATCAHRRAALAALVGAGHYVLP